MPALRHYRLSLRDQCRSRIRILQQLQAAHSPTEVMIAGICQGNLFAIDSYACLIQIHGDSASALTAGAMSREITSPISQT